MTTGYAMPFVAACALLETMPAAAAQRTYANPVDIDYRYNFEQRDQGISYRTGADPVIVRHDGAYYLFATLADVTGVPPTCWTGAS